MLSASNIIKNPIRNIVEKHSNLVNYSYDLTKWTQTGTAVSALNAVGIFGESNTATTLTDDDVAAYERVERIVTIPATYFSICWTVILPVDADTSRYLYFDVAVTNGARYVDFMFNTTTGDYYVKNHTGNYSIKAYNINGWWVIVVYVNADGGGTNARCRIFPAGGNVWGTISTATTGTVVIGHAQCEINKREPEGIIVTNGTAKTGSMIKPIPFSRLVQPA